MASTIFSVVYPGRDAFSEGDVELVRSQELNLAPRSPRHLVPDVIERAAAGIHFLVPAQAVKEGVPFARGSRVTRVAGNERAEVSLCRHDLVDIIVFENASLPGYTTEKIVEAMAARCLPIYWGNPVIQREFNPKSFLNYFDFQDEEALIERIIELDESDSLYRQHLAEPYFHHNRPNEFFSLDRVLDHFEMIFSASIRPVARRRRLFSFGRWTLARRDPT